VSASSLSLASAGLRAGNIPPVHMIDCDIMIPLGWLELRSGIGMQLSRARTDKRYGVVPYGIAPAKVYNNYPVLI
jgi:hypothetical protein